MHTPLVNYNIAASILKRGQLDPNNRAYVFEGIERSYDELNSRVLRLAQSLREQGVCLGDRVGFLGLNHPHFIETMLATQALGAIFVPLNFRLTGEELTYIINDAGIHTLVVDDALTPVVSPICEDLCCKRYIASESAQQNWDTLDNIFAADSAITSPVETSENETAVIMYTSGTTGQPTDRFDNIKN